MLTDKMHKKSIFLSGVEYIVLVFCATFVIELVSRGSIRATMEYCMDNTKLFLLNMMLVNCLYASIFLFKHRRVCAFHVTLALALFIIAHFMLIKMRGTPLVFSDIRAVGFGAAILLEMVNLYWIVGIGIMLLIGYVFILKKLMPVKEKRNIILFAVSISLCVIYVSFIEASGIVSHNAWAQNTDYLSNGALYSFVNSYRDNKVSKPEGYDEKAFLEIRKMIEQEAGAFSESEDKINIVMLQVEAWTDPMDIPGITYSEDPMPHLRAAMNQYSSGNLNVNILGGATVNTEFEVLTGLPIENRPAGEYPYLTVLSHKSVEALPFYLNEQYKTTAVHNYYGDFYNRDKVFANMGFQRYISMETMKNIRRDGYYPSDSAFVDYIPRILEESPERDFIYGITVEMHGPYATEALDGVKIECTGGEYTEETLNNIERYVNSLNKTDEYLGELFTYFDSVDEPVICFVFGDHQPALELWNNESFYKNNPEYNFYQVPYVCYNNMNLSKINEDMDADRVGDYLLKLTKNNGGTVSKFHDVYSGKAEYEQYLKLLEYDILSGKDYIYEGNKPYIAQEMEYGLEDMVCSAVKEEKEGTITVYGEGFNESCKAVLNDKNVKVEYIDEHKMTVDVDLRDGDVLTIYRKGLYRIIGNTVEITEEDIK